MQSHHQPPPNPQPPSRADIIQAARHPNIGRSLARVYRTLSESGTAELRRRGHQINITHATVVPLVDLEGTRLSVLAERVGVTKQAMTQLVQELERHGYVSRQPDLSDRRAQIIQTTERGWQLLDDLFEMRQMMEESIDRHLGTTDAEVLHRLLLDLANEYTGYGIQAAPTGSHDYNADVMTLNFSGHSGIYHAQGRSIVLKGSGNSLTIRGVCPHLWIHGNGNAIAIDTVGAITVEGAGNTGVWKQAIGGKCPQLLLPNKGNYFTYRQH